MSLVRIITDSACDLTPAMATEFDITVVPLTIRFGDAEYVDRQDLNVQQFWAKVAESKELPQTAAPAPGLFGAAFDKAESEGATDIVVITLSGKLSATIESAQLAARQYQGRAQVHIVDSNSITMGQGHMARESAKAAAQGKSVQEILDFISAVIPLTHVFGALNTLDNLKKGGRIGSAQAFFGSILSVKPILDLSSGAVVAMGKQRTRSKSLAHLASIVAAETAKHGRVENVSVMHGDATDVEEFLELLAPSFPRDEIVVGQIGAVIGTHGGPGVMGLTYNLPLGVK